MSPSFSLRIYQCKDRYAVASNGFSDTRLHDLETQTVHRVELLLYVPLDWDMEALTNADSDWSWPVDWLRRIANSHAERNFWFGSGGMAEEVSILHGLQMPLAGYSACLYLTEGPPLGLIPLTESESISIITLFPLYQSEYEFLKKDGAVALIEKFREAKLSTMLSQLRYPGI